MSKSSIVKTLPIGKTCRNQLAKRADKFSMVNKRLSNCFCICPYIEDCSSFGAVCRWINEC